MLARLTLRTLLLAGLTFYLGAILYFFGRSAPGPTLRKPAPATPNQIPATPNHDLVLETAHGDLRVRLFERETPASAALVRAVARLPGPCAPCRFYRAEPVPPFWGDAARPDSSFGGRWGPPYALLQGSIGRHPALAPRAADAGAGARPAPLRRGQLAWAGGASANLADFFVALADHPEWGHAHTVFGEVVDADMAVADRIVQLPRRTNKPARPSDPEVTQLVEPVPFALRLS